MTGDAPKGHKKSDTFQIRIPHDIKKQFLIACQEDRVSASEVLRRAILDYLSLRGRPSSSERKGLPDMIPTTLRRRRFVAVGAAGAAALAVLVALPSAADPAFQTAFQKIDKNRDGVLTPEEFFGSDLPPETVAETRRSMRQDKPAPDPATLKVSHEDYVNLYPRSAGHPEGEWGLYMHISASFENAPDGFDPSTFDFRGAAEFDPVATAFIAMDADASDAISYAEFEVRFRALLAKGFDRLDRDRDGYLVDMEFMRSGGWLTELAEDGTETPVPAERLRVGFVRLDADGDGRLSLQEYLPKA